MVGARKEAGTLPRPILEVTPGTPASRRLGASNRNGRRFSFRALADDQAVIYRLPFGAGASGHAANTFTPDLEITHETIGRCSCAVRTLAALAQTAIQGNLEGDLLGLTALICAATTFRSVAISSFLKIFVGIFSIETILFGLAVLAGRAGLWLAAYADIHGAGLAPAHRRDLFDPGLLGGAARHGAADHADRRPLFRRR